LAALAQRARIVDQEEELVRAVGVDREGARELLAAAEPGWLGPELMDDLLRAYGIAAPAMAVARSGAQAAEMASKMGFPVALKIVSPDIVHKSDAGGIALNLVNGAMVERAFAEMMARTHEIYPEAKISGVQVQRMVSGGQEVIAGVSRDAQFGPLVMFGSGGIEVEGLQDVAFELAPLTGGAARRLLEETWAGKKLAGFRHLAAVDEAAVVDILIRLGQMAIDLPRLAEIEINPLLVLAGGATAVDVRAAWK